MSTQDIVGIVAFIFIMIIGFLAFQTAYRVLKR